MYSMIRHPKFPFLLLLFISVAASNAFVPRRHRRYKTEASSRPSIVDSNQSLKQSDAILPFGLNIRGGDLAEKVVTSEAAKNDEEAIEEAADSDEIATRVWEEEIKRTRSFYQEQSVNNDDDIGDEDDANNVQDEDSESSPAASDSEVVSTEEVDDSEPEQIDEDIDDVVEVKEDTEGVEEVNQMEEVAVGVVDVSENESAVEALEEAQEEVAEEDEEALQVEVVAEEQSSGSGEVETADTEEIIGSEEDEINKVVEISDEAVTEEVAEGEEVVAGEIAGEVEEVSEGDQATAMEENADSVDIVNTSESSVVATDGDAVAKGDADAASNDESSENTPKQDASSVAVQVQVVAEEQSSGSKEVETADTGEIIALEEDEINKVVEISDEAVTGEIAEGEEVVAGEITDEVEEVSEGDAMEENADSVDIVDTSESSVVATDDDAVAKGDTDATANDESSEHTPEQDASSVAVTTDEPTSLVRKASALVQVMLIRGRIAVSKNKGVQYLAQNKATIKVIALASLGGVLSLLVGGRVFLAMQEADNLELPNDEEWIEEEIIFADDTDEDDNDS